MHAEQWRTHTHRHKCQLNNKHTRPAHSNQSSPMGQGSGCQIATVTQAKFNSDFTFHSGSRFHLLYKQINSKREVRAGQLLPRVSFLSLFFFLFLFPVGLRQEASGPSCGSRLFEKHPQGRMQICVNVHRHSVYLTKRRKSNSRPGGLFHYKAVSPRGRKGLFSLSSTDTVYIRRAENPSEDKALHHNICI